MKSVIIALSLVAALNVFGGDQRDERSIWHSPHSGIVGQAVISVCPVLIEGSPCLPQPFRNTFNVYTDKGHLIETVTTDEEGVFLVHLQPGTYTIVPWTSGDCFHAPCAAPQTIKVEHKKFTTVEIGYVLFVL